MKLVIVVAHLENVIKEAKVHSIPFPLCLIRLIDPSRCANTPFLPLYISFLYVHYSIDVSALQCTGLWLLQHLVPLPRLSLDSLLRREVHEAQEYLPCVTCFYQASFLCFSPCHPTLFLIPPLSAIHYKLLTSPI